MLRFYSSRFGVGYINMVLFSSFETNWFICILYFSTSINNNLKNNYAWLGEREFFFEIYKTNLMEFSYIHEI